MTDNPTEFTHAWGEFEARLGEALLALAAPASRGIMRLCAASPGDTTRRIEFEGRLGAAEGRLAQGIDVRVAGRRSEFHPLDADAVEAESLTRITTRIRVILREDWAVAHPSFLTSDAEGFGGLEVRVRGLPAPESILRESAHVGRSRVLFPQSPDETRAAVERCLRGRFGQVQPDDDGDYQVEVDGMGIFLTVTEDQPAIRLWRPVVWHVRSRSAAVIEANYLNRVHPTTKWVLWGHSLVQETYLAAAPFVPELLLDQLDRFAEHVADNASALRLRLEGE